jgi:hypothetical protein
MESYFFLMKKSNKIKPENKSLKLRLMAYLTATRSPPLISNVVFPILFLFKGGEISNVTIFRLGN